MDVGARFPRARAVSDWGFLLDPKLQWSNQRLTPRKHWRSKATASATRRRP